MNDTQANRDRFIEVIVELLKKADVKNLTSSGLLRRALSANTGNPLKKERVHNNFCFDHKRSKKGRNHERNEAFFRHLQH